MQQNDLSLVQAEAAANTSLWHKQDTVWMLGLYGTAIGAGTLFLPINAGLNGVWPLIVMAIIAFPLTYFSHRALCRFILSGASQKDNITEVVEEHFGAVAGKILRFLYFFSIYPIMLLYSVAITNTTQSFLVNQLGWTPPPRALLAILLLCALMAVVRLGQQFIVKAMSVLVYPFITVLILLALYLIPYWNTSVFTQAAVNSAGNHISLLKTLWLLIPVMVFSFNHSPIISSFAVGQKQFYGTQDKAEPHCNRILRASHLLMVGTVMFFVFSCVLSLSSHDLMLAKQQNISILSYLANHFNTPLIAYIAPFVAFIAITKSFFGHYLGAAEGLKGILSKSLSRYQIMYRPTALAWVVDILMIVTCWWVATINPSILGMIEILVGPVIAAILFLMPMYAIYRVPALKPYRQKMADIFISAIGVIALSAIFYGMLVH